MAGHVSPGGMPTPASQPLFDGVATTRSLLAYGVVVGPFYLAVGLAQAFVREGFDLGRHPLSLLANGPGGWIQTMNFVLSGALVIAGAVGIARAIRPHSTGVSWFLGAFGASMVVAAVFRADPMDGFPVGTPLGPPTALSARGTGHFVAGALGFVALAISALVAARVLWSAAPPLARFSLFAGLAVLVGFFGGPALGGRGGPVLGIWFAVIVGFAWLTIISYSLYRQVSDPR